MEEGAAMAGLVIQKAAGRVRARFEKGSQAVEDNDDPAAG